MSEQGFVDVMPDDMRWGHAFGPGVGGAEIHYVLHGNGIPILLLHGWPGFWYDWRYLIPLLGGQFRLVVPDLRGFGDSDAPEVAPDDGYTPEVMARDLFALLDHIGLPEVVVAGHDLGAVVAQFMARCEPERVRALALFNPPYPGIGDRWSETADARWFEHFHRLPLAEKLVTYELGATELYLNHFHRRLSAHPEAVRVDEFEAILRIYSRPGAFERSLRSQRTTSLPGRWWGPDPILPIAQPTTVAWSDADPLAPLTWADRLPEHFSHLTRVSLPTIGHWAPIEAPQEVAATIRTAVGTTIGS